MGPGQAHRGNNIDAIRLLLAVLVIYSHSYPLTQGSNQSEPLVRLSHGQSTIGSLAVDGFFILSGYLISQSWQRSTTAWSYLDKRIRRIYPAYLVSVLACLLIVVPLAGSLTDVQSVLLPANLWRPLALRGFIAPDVFSTNPYPGAINGSLWTIQYEFTCYVGVMAFGALGLLHRRMILCGILLMSIAFHVVVERAGIRFAKSILDTTVGDPDQWARLLPCFLSGATFYTFRDQLILDGKAALVCMGGLAVLTQVSGGLALGVPLLGAYALLWLSFTSEVNLKGWARFGDFSYGTYLYAFPAQQLIVQQCTGITPLKLFAIATPVSVLCGIISWWTIEKWCISRRAKAAPS